MFDVSIESEGLSLRVKREGHILLSTSGSFDVERSKALARPFEEGSCLVMRRVFGVAHRDDAFHQQRTGAVAIRSFFGLD